MGKDKKVKKGREDREKSETPGDKSPTLTEVNEDVDLKPKDSKHSKKSKKNVTERQSSLDGKGDISINSLAQNSDEDSELEIITLEQQGIKKKKPKRMKAFNLLEIEGDDDVDTKDDSDEESTTKTRTKDSKPEKKQKKSKKKERKKKDDDDEDLEKLLEELALEMHGKPGKTKTEKETVSEVKSTETPSEEIPEKPKEKKKKVVESKDDVDEDKEPSPDVEGAAMKTAAQKKKEKKEKEKQKRAEQYEQMMQKKKPDGEASKKKPEGAEPKSKPDVAEAKKKPSEEPKKKAAAEKKDAENEKPSAEAADDDDTKMDEEGDEKKKKKDKKKKKVVEEEDKKDKKRPGKKQIAAMQEALRKVKEEEERLRLEEEARIKAIEEAERLKQEQLRLEQEKREIRKQKEKERKERLKAEGKLLTKAQKQNQARIEATLAALRQQGISVPEVGEKRGKGPRPGDRKKPQKRKPVVPEPEPVVEPPKLEIEKEVSPEIEPKSSSVSEDENIKDAWYETSSEDEQKEEKLAPKKVEKKNEKMSESEEDSEETSSEDSEDESSESESSEEEGKQDEATRIERVKLRIQKRREMAESNRNLEKLRSPVVCVLGHVDTGKTKILDKIRNSHVQDGEAGGITQQIGATMVPLQTLKEQCKMVKNFVDSEVKVPGLLIIDTPGHESFSNLRSRGSSLCDIAILVVDITHGLEPQTIESINMLKQKKTPFVVALNKIDRIYDWKSMKNKDVQDILKGQSRATRQFFEDRVKQVVLEFATQSLNAVLFSENTDPRSYVSMVPTSALTGEGMGNLMALVVELVQSMMAKRLMFSEELQATILEVKAISGLGHTMDVILVNGRLHEGDTIVFAGFDGPVSSQIRSLLMPQPLKELRIKTQFLEHREVEGSQGVKIAGKDLEKAIAGLPLLVPHRADETKILMDEIASMFRETMNSIKVTGMGVYVQASTLGSLEALMEFLTESKIPVSGVRIGPVTKKDVMRASAMLEHDPTFAVILAFDVKIEKEAQELADSLSIRIFHANIIYHLFDMFVNYRMELKTKNREQFKNAAVFPCKLKILPQFIFNTRDPIVVGVSVEAGVVKEGTPLCVPSKEFLEIGIVTTIEVNHKQIETARKGQEVCIKIEPTGGDAPKLYGRHFDHTDLLVSKITRYSIDMCKEHFRDDLQKTDWQLMVELKKLFQIL